MVSYDSDSSGADDAATNVLLGYASTEPTGDDFSQLGGRPVWLDDQTAPPGELAKCKVCNSLMTLLLQLNGDLPDRFPGHERRLYIWSCREKACRRKDGSIRGIRATKIDAAGASKAPAEQQALTTTPAGGVDPKPAPNLGNALFGVKTPSASIGNPFAVPSVAIGPSTAGPSATTSLAVKPAQKPATEELLPETFAQKVRISSPSPAESVHPHTGRQEPWPDTTAFPAPYTKYYLDADHEYLDSDSHEVPSNARLATSTIGESGSSSDDKAAFESSMDKTFQQFADRLSQNPEQVMRYEYDGQPLLYSKSDAIGKLLQPALGNANVKVQTVARGGDALYRRLPKCANCGSARTFELQLTPHAITELEAEEISIDGMDWGTIIFAVCTAGCQERGRADGEVGYVEEWVGIQWEELTGKGRQ